MGTKKGNPPGGLPSGFQGGGTLASWVVTPWFEIQASGGTGPPQSK